MAEAVNCSSEPALTRWFAIGASTGATLTSATWTENVRLASSAGVPLSVTRTVML